MRSANIPRELRRAVVGCVFAAVVAAPLCVVAPSVVGAASRDNLRVYGYFDMEAEVSNAGGGARLWTFDQHHLNILSTYTIDDRFRVLTEVEFEHGPFHDSTPTGTIYVPTALVEFKYSDAFKVRTGIFLTPFGIYNERHDATVTFISTVLPQSIYGKRANEAGGKEREFAKIGTGIEFTGRLSHGDWESQYAAYVINGRGPNASEQDNNANKGVGARWTLAPPVHGLSIGASYFQDRDGNAFNASHRILAADVSYEANRVFFEAEVMRPRHEEVDSTGAPTGQFGTHLGYYAQAAFTVTPHLRPFARFSRFDEDTDAAGGMETHYVVGVNVPITPAVFLKAEGHNINFNDDPAKDYEMFVASMAVAF